MNALLELGIGRPQNNELQRTRDGNAAASPLNSVFDDLFEGRGAWAF
jgi:hypothetical protein